MFDTHTAFQQLVHQNFAFKAGRYELWKGGQMVDSGSSNCVVRAVAGNSDTTIVLEGNAPFGEVSEEQKYDIFITGSDRLQLLTIPSSTSNENVALNMFKMVIGATRDAYEFGSEEAYCCNLFTQQGAIKKITFSFHHPEKLLEFYEANDAESDDFNLNFEFKSEDHLRFENGVQTSGPHGGAPRLIKVEPNINGNEGVTVSMYNLQGNHPVWKNNLQMAHKPMKVINQSDDRLVLRGYGEDAFGTSFADYGLTIMYKPNGEVKKCILHMHDRGVDIAYFEKLSDII